jgi:hypothetical protein
MLNPDLAYMRETHYQAALWAWAWAWAEGQAFLMNEYVDEIGIEEASKVLRGRASKLETARKLSVTAMNRRSRLGLDPTSYARLSNDVAGKQQMEVATYLSAGRARHEQAEQDN